MVQHRILDLRKYKRQVEFCTDCQNAISLFYSTSVACSVTVLTNQVKTCYPVIGFRLGEACMEITAIHVIFSLELHPHARMRRFYFFIIGNEFKVQVLVYGGYKTHASLLC